MIREKENLLFTFIPTMRCNYRCEYCFLSNEEKSGGSTMFDDHSPDEWIEAMMKFSEYNVEPYMWGGEPFCVDGTYEILREWVKMDHVITGFRIDTNVYFAEKIVRECPSEKIKLNCSYHMQYHSLEEEFRKVKLLKEYDMIAMVNFVASPYNLRHLKEDYGMTVSDLINKFGEIGVFVNIAGDFTFANDPTYEKHDEYQRFIQQFISPDEWKWLRGVNKKTMCEAGRKSFLVGNDGEITTCMAIDNSNRGNFLKGTLIRDDLNRQCNGGCRPIIKYSFRCDNDFPTANHLLGYIQRNEEYRNSRREAFEDFAF
ncbi:4Fe-4S cluster-binding domain-containing protein [Butyrivibrio sp. NC2007]|uniref:4Fe-4S cluster-binding domain-containing protein n=1 Tax=Butyrivibrio sp. NC2007 TaxID=1280683 RepID=UPI0003B56CE6|nr:4Fe-4S cluster-binding domain-containing protein [Butyrivibrio sp. NC2007]